MSKLDLNAKYTILGLGISGFATLEFLISKGFKKVFISETKDSLDLREKLYKYSNQIQIDYELGIPHSDKCLESDYLIVSPSISLEEPIIQKAKELNKKVLTEIELASGEINKFIAITGTNGKSTTTAWIGHILNSPPCGNIGLPFVKALSMAEPNNYYICECSSFQLAHSFALKPNIALITNITPDHILWHGSWEEYLKAKTKITQFQSSDDWLLLPDTKPLNQIQSLAQIMWIENKIQKTSLKKHALWINENKEIILRINEVDQMICSIQALPLPGWHNLENAMFTIGACALAGLAINQIQEGLLSFAGLEHRLEFITQIKDKQFFNDSKATNPESSIVALRAFDGDIIWLAGGRDKMTSLKDLNLEVKKRVNTAIFYGEAADRFYSELLESGFQKKVYKVQNLDSALNLAMEQVGKIVLLSPSCASFDQFNSFEERGKYFKQLVQSLKKEIANPRLSY